MGTQPVPRLGRTAVRTACAAALLAVPLTGCADTSGDAAPRPSSGRTGPPEAGTSAPRPTAPREVCTALITHWATVLLDGGPQGQLDYQAMGLSGGQYDILREVVATARATERTHGPAAARERAARDAGLRCAERHRSGDPTGGPWT
ncbi:hypothetical protein [Streptomyces sp. NPDC012888]|uniref:hypothetical protein n=1 Tax=Streptomyces sp. NPDC012888 TaxID=3364855 RepID=UPI0036886BF4